MNTVYDENEFHQAFFILCHEKSPMPATGSGSNTSSSWGQVGRILKVALEQKVLYGVMGPLKHCNQSLTTDYFQRRGLVLDAGAPKVA